MKILLMSAAAASCLVVSSCNKVYECECTFSQNPSMIIEYTKVTQSDAKSSCAVVEGNYQTTDSTAKCSLR